MKKVLLVAAAALCGFAPSSQAGRLSAGLEAQIAGLNGEDEIKVLVTMVEQADIPSLDLTLRMTGASMATRHAQVINELRDIADRTQAPLRQEMEFGRDTGIRGYTSYWILNGMTVVGTVDAIREIAARPDVDLVEPDLQVELIEPITRDPNKEAVMPRGGGITPGVLAIEADRVWNELGIDGTGALVGNMDTGVDGAHPALSARWRGNFAPAAECWKDAVGFGHATPQDTHGHGTHVMGTITGSAPGNQIGVAPGALWIADNTINQGAGSAFDNDVLSGLQWFADPDGNPGTTDDVPDVVQHSWGVHEGFSGYVDCDSRWWAAIDNCEAAGVVNTWSAGNEGSGSGTLRSPADRAETPFDSFSVGSTQHTAPFNISSFSSRGPSTCSPAAHPIKPEVSAPGSDIWSAQPGGGYQFLSGTSMAGPHVAGVVALMRAANPDVDVQTVKQILMDTATDLGAAGEDNTYGHGLINAYDAVLAVLSGYGSVSGQVTDNGSSAGIPNAFVDVIGDTRSATADANGDFSLFLPAGEWTLEYSAFGYVTAQQSVTVIENDDVSADFALMLAPQATISGVVRDYTNALVDGATVTVLDTPLSSVTTAPDGSYSINVPDLATYDVRARKDGFGADLHAVAVSGNQTQDFVLPELVGEDFESGDFINWPWSQGGNADWTIDTGNVQEGTYSARSGSISHNQESSMSISLNLVAGGDLTFWYSVDSEATYDFLRFYIDGVQQDSWSGSVPWTEATYAVSAGQRTFEWRYTKDVSVSTGADAGWVDAITFPAAAFPEVDVTPGSVAETLGYDSQSQLPLTINNTGEGPLDYTVEITGTSSPALGQGGPDNFGYRWVDSNQGGGPTYDWVDITGVGTALSLGNNAYSNPQAFGFNFNYYQGIYASARVASNGYLQIIGVPTSDPNNDPIPTGTDPNAIIAPFWDNLNPSAGGTVYTYADTANDRFIVTWDGVHRQATGTPHTFQVILQDDGRMFFQYANVSEGDECTVGIESLTGTDGLEVAYDEAYLENGLTIEFTDAPLPEWLAVSPMSGQVTQLSSEDLTLDFDSTGLLDGTYLKNIRIHTNDTDEPQVDVLTSLTVEDGVVSAVTLTPNQFALSSARPNPFAGGKTSWSFAIPAGGAKVNVSVYDISGRLVRTLVDDVRSAGLHSVEWDGRDSGGQHVASGVYFTRMDAGEFREVRKVTVLK